MTLSFLLCIFSILLIAFENSPNSSIIMLIQFHVLLLPRTYPLPALRKCPYCTRRPFSLRNPSHLQIKFNTTPFIKLPVTISAKLNNIQYHFINKTKINGVRVNIYGINVVK